MRKAINRFLRKYGPLIVVAIVPLAVGYFSWKQEPGDALSNMIRVLESNEVKMLVVTTSSDGGSSTIDLKYVREVGRKPFTQIPITEIKTMTATVPDSFMPRFWELQKARNLPIQTKTNKFGGIFKMLLPIIGSFVFFFLISKQFGGMMGGKGRNPFFNGASFTSERPKTRFKDVAGVGEAKGELLEILEFLRDPSGLKKLGGRVPRGVLLLGPTGTGKTLLARALAGEADTPFFYISGSQFMEMFVGVGPSRVRDLFQTARQNAPCILFIDEIDAIGGKRGPRMDGAGDERQATLNQLLQEMDGFRESDGVVVVAATNLFESLDPALLRPGRFDRKIIVPAPTSEEREAILQVIIKRQNVVLDEDVDIVSIAQATLRFTGAELENLINSAVIRAKREKRSKVSQRDFDNAWDSIVMGSEGTVILFEELRRTTAHHESGHAVCAYVNQRRRREASHRRVHSVSILRRRAHSLGRVIMLPTREDEYFSREDLVEELAMLYGGIAGEEMQAQMENREYIPASGASSDIESATNLARRMVLEFGMGTKCGRKSYVRTGRRQDEKEEISLSGRTLEMVEDDVNELCDLGLERARKTVTDNQKLFEAFIGELMAANQLYLSDLDRIAGTNKVVLELVA